MYALAECGLIHKYLLKKEDIKRIEEETFFTITVVKELDGYQVIEGENKITLSNGSETLVFKKAERTMWDFAYYLDEYSLGKMFVQTNWNNKKNVHKEVRKMNKKKNYAKLEKRVVELEKRVAALEGPVQAQLKDIDIKPIVNIDKDFDVNKITDLVAQKIIP